jgi:hypothetical protein
MKTLSFTFLVSRYISLHLLLSCGCHRKYRDEKLHIEDGRADFECAWLLNPTTSGHHVIFPKHLQQIDKMTKWVKDAIQTYQLTSACLIDEDFVHLLISPSFICLAFKKMKVYRNHFQVDDEQNCLLITYDFGVASVF